MRILLILAIAALAAAKEHRLDCAGKGEFKTLEEVNAAALSRGDRVLLKAGCRWIGQLIAKPGVAYGRYGKGAMPRIDADGRFEDAVLIRNASGSSVRDLEVTNTGQGEAARRGVHIVAENIGVISNVVVAGMYIHDVNGTNKRKDNGGIIFRTTGNKTPSRFEGLTIERNLIWKVDRSAIAAVSYHATRTRWNPSLRVVIRDNHVEDIGGDGIVPWATDGVLVEHNVAKDCNKRANTFNAGIWPWSTDNTVMRLNRASFTRTTMDGQGFDSDYNSRNTLIEYNLSHDNEGGFLLICTPGKRNQAENLGNQGTIARYNISRNDKARTFHVGGAAEKTLVQGNAVYVAPAADVQLLLVGDWSGWAKGLELRDNLFHVEGTARYGHEISRSKDGSYQIAPGWGPAEGVVFTGNTYDGNHVDKPADSATGKAPKVLKDSEWNWPGPQLDPARPEGFSRYIKAHRVWMIGLMEKQFGVKLK